MNKAITDGLVLMPPPFSAGLNLWSREDGTPGSGSWAGQPNAAYVPADQDFGGCLELQKTESTQKLRCFAQIPMQPGMYLRVTARVKALAGNLPSVRIAGWAGSVTGGNVAAAVQQGPSVALTSYGAVVTVQAIIGGGNRQGVDMVWGTVPVYGHLGLDLTGATGGVVRIDDIVIEDVTDVFHRKMMDWVDVRDYGAVGDGVTDDTAAFAAADAAAAGRMVLVSAGSYYLGSHMTFESRVRFEGTVTMPAAMRLACTRNYDLDTYAAAFGSEIAGFRKALQALFYFTDHVTLDLSGRRIDLAEPIDVAAVCGLASFAQRRLLTNGQFNALTGSAWDSATTTSVATYSVADPGRLTGVANVANIEVGSRITGTGVGREVYVRSKNIGAGTVELSQPLWGAAGTRNFSFTRYRYILDFSGFSALSKFEITDIEFQCNGRASGIMLAPAGSVFRMADCVVNLPKDRGMTSTGAGCQGLLLDQCQFLSNEQGVVAQDRTTVALNVNSNDTKIRNNRIVRFAHFAVLKGSGHMILGNHFFQGDDSAAGLRRAGLVFTQTNVSSIVSGNYVDNCFIEWTNEHDQSPEFFNEFSFGGLNINTNIFIASNVAPSFRWIVITPYGPGHFISGMSIVGNSFRVYNATIDRVEKVDTSFATLDYGRFRNVLVDTNSFNAVEQGTVSPVTIEHTQNTAADTWVVDGSAFMPFGAWARNVRSVVAEGAITSAANVAQTITPFVQVEQGPGKGMVNLRWPSAVKGMVHVTLRCDNPV
ncbi:glycosyl hydrolase family 28-related protein [Paracoccaceae bacterium Fryx2]|nr:glycosyl hydrolase family 28-related protein [Paracoccaceae bacterium Fryx2]